MSGRPHFGMKYGPLFRMKANLNQLPLPDALRVKRAELWLKLGQPAEALKELKTLSAKARAHPWASQVSCAASETCCAFASLSPSP